LVPGWGDGANRASLAMAKNQTGTVYGIFDPSARLLVYVGATTKKRLHDRLCEHMWSARNAPPAYRQVLHDWMAPLLARGLRPEIAPLEGGIPLERLHAEETWHIQYWRSIGCPLLNVRDRPGWERGRKHTAEHRAAVSRALTGRECPHMRGPMAVSRRRAISRAHGGRPFVDSLGNRFETHREAARFHGMRHVLIQRVLAGERPHTKGLRFTYLDASSGPKLPLG